MSTKKKHDKVKNGNPPAIPPGNEITTLLAPGEVQQQLRVCRHTLRRWEIAGRIKAVRFGRRVIRFRRAEIQRLIQEGE
jgi:excisionase family DNA binding protein